MIGTSFIILVGLRNVAFISDPCLEKGPGSNSLLHIPPPSPDLAWPKLMESFGMVRSSDSLSYFAGGKIKFDNLLLKELFFGITYHVRFSRACRNNTRDTD